MFPSKLLYGTRYYFFDSYFVILLSWKSLFLEFDTKNYQSVCLLYEYRCFGVFFCRWKIIPLSAHNYLIRPTRCAVEHPRLFDMYVM